MTLCYGYSEDMIYCNGMIVTCDDVISCNGMMVTCDDMISCDGMMVTCDDMISCNGMMVAFWRYDSLSKYHTDGNFVKI